MSTKIEIQKHKELIAAKKSAISNHKLYKSLNSQTALKEFMEWHIFAVWDFMSLLKSLQNKVTCTEVPWNPSPYPGEVVRLVNEIVTGEESDINFDGQVLSHFEMYKLAMDEVGAITENIDEFLESLDFSILPSGLREFVSFNLDHALNSPAHIVAGVFLYGREKLIPEMFTGMLKTLNQNREKFPQTLYYFDRHIEVDSEEHGPMAERCLEILVENQEQELEMLEAALKSLELREQLWDGCLRKLNEKVGKSPSKFL